MPVTECRPTPDWDHDDTGFVVHRGRLLDVDGLLVELAQGETDSPLGDLQDQDSIVVLVDGAGGGLELTPAQAA